MASLPPPPLPAALRPVTVAQLVDGGFQAVRARPRLLLGLGLLFLLPVVAVTALVGDGDATRGLITSGSPVGGIVGWCLYSLATCLLGLPVSAVVAEVLAGRNPGLRAALSLPGRCWVGAVLCWAPLFVAKVLGAGLLGAPAVVVSAYGLVVSPVLALERVGPWRALRRSAGLVGSGFGRVLGVLGLQVLVTVVVVGTVGLFPVVGALAASDPVRRPLANLVQLGLWLVVTPPAVCTSTLVYLDLRIRAEAFDLDRELATGAFGQGRG